MSDPSMEEALHEIASMHQTKKGNQWYLGMKARIGVDEFSALVHHVKCTSANVGDVTVTGADSVADRAWPENSGIKAGSSEHP